MSTEDDKRHSDAFIENADAPPHASKLDPNDELYVKLDPEQRAIAEKKLVRKLDSRLLPTIICIFILNYIDRNNVAAARLKGLEQDLKLTDVEYSTVLAILYASYCPAQIPSNMILNRITRPAIYIGVCTILWGLTSALTGVTHNFAGIIACRFFIGLPESAFYPGAIYLLSRWYTKKELSFRSCILYGGLLISNAFGSLMAAGILSHLEGKRGIRGWRWLFYIEGALTMFIGLNALWLLPDYPHNTRWLSAEERHLAQVRLAEDAGEADEDTASDSALSGLWAAMNDPKVPIMAIMTTSQLLGLSFINFFPTLTATLGFSTSISLLLAAPPWILATMVCCLNAWHADRTGERFFHIAGLWWFTLLGYIIGVSTGSVGGRYVAMFLMALGYCGFAMTLVWVSNIIPRPPAKRAAAIGIVNGVGNLGNLIGSYAWKAQWGPDYHNSMYIGIACLTLSTTLALIVRQMLIRKNRLMDEADAAELMHGGHRQRIEDAAKLEGITIDEAIQRRKGFRYLY